MVDYQLQQGAFSSNFFECNCNKRAFTLICAGMLVHEWKKMHHLLRVFHLRRALRRDGVRTCSSPLCIGSSCLDDLCSNAMNQQCVRTVRQAKAFLGNVSLIGLEYDDFHGHHVVKIEKHITRDGKIFCERCVCTHG